jgi:hypothetical protein
MTARAPSRADGNRLWRVRLPGHRDADGGTVLQKTYGERGSCWHVHARELATRLRGGKTSTRARGRRATEARLLALWRAAGLDVPADLSDEHPELAGPTTLVLQYVPGRLLSDWLADPATPGARRRELLTAWARALHRRLALALERGDAGLVQEHGGALHVIVSGERLVGFDLENGFLQRADLRPLVYKELAACLRSLARGRDAAGFRSDLSTFVAAFPERELLRATARHYLHPASPMDRLIWTIDRRRSQRRGGAAGKYHALEALEAELASRA